jgi:FkbM family methyltransferase
VLFLLTLSIGINVRTRFGDTSIGGRPAASQAEIPSFRRTARACPERRPLPARDVAPEKNYNNSMLPERAHWAFDPASGLVVRGDSGEERYLFEHYFKPGQGDGVVVEIGGHDGITKSISMSLENSLGWRALLIEPAPSNFQKILRYRPHTQVFNTAVCNVPKMLHFVELDSVGGILEFMPEEFLKKYFPKEWFKADGSTDIAHIESSAMCTFIQCAPMSLLLRLAGVCHVDLFVLDVQGAELEVLKSFDFDEVSVSVWCIEVEKNNVQDKRDIISLLGANGYVLQAGVKNNLWFHEKNFPVRV